MIQLDKKSDCCGCGACFQICPAECIEMITDEEGFKYPEFKTDMCTGCGLCIKVCPEINKTVKSKPFKVFAAKNIEHKKVVESSSGGVFSVLAENTVNSAGTVFGAIFNKEFEVVHYGTSEYSEISLLRTSKYVQSDTGQTFIETRSLLDEGKIVLFSGTPCQIKGLKLFLGKDYQNLITVDFICHGVPGSGIWKKYLHEIIKKNGICSVSEIKEINFRDKSFGWRKFSLKISDFNGETVLLQSLRENTFLKGFLKDLYLRPSCHKCPAKGLSSGSDITIADFWGVQKILPEFNDDKGISLVILNSGKTENMFKNHCDIREVDKKVLKKNYALYNSVIMNFNRKAFFRDLKENSELEPLIRKYSEHSFFERLTRKLLIISSRLLNLMR